jgi:hypothetical protein
MFLINPYRFAAAPLLLDTYSGAAAAYSLRQLRTAHTSAVVRVRRSSDNAEQDFTATQVTDGTLTSFCGVGNGFVRTWYDQSGNIKDANQASTASQPQVVSGGVLITRNTRPTVRFSSSELFIAASLVSSQLFTLCTVVSSSNTSAGEREIISNWSPPGNNYIFLGTSGSTIRFTDRVVNAGSFGATNTLKALDGYSGSGFYQFYVNNSQTASGGGFSGLVTNTNWYIGVQGTFTGKEYWSGDMSEIIVYPTDQSVNRSAIAADINLHFALY